VKIVPAIFKALAINPHYQSPFTLHLTQKAHTPTHFYYPIHFYYYKWLCDLLLLMAKAKYILFLSKPRLEEAV